MTSAGHMVTALIRNPSSLTPRDGLEIVQGTPENLDDVRKAMRGSASGPCDAVVVTLNAPRESDSPFAKPLVGPRFMADAVGNVEKAMKEQGLKKIVIMSTFGTGDSFKNLNFLMKPIIRHTNMSI